MRPIGKEGIGKIPDYFVANVVDHGFENNDSRPVEDLTPAEFLGRYLSWNGIIGYAEFIVQLVEALGWRLEQPAPRTMPDADRGRLIELLLELASTTYQDDSGDAVEDALEYELNGTRGLSNESDEALLAEAGGNYEDGEDGEGALVLGPLGDNFDPTTDELFRIWARHAHPEVLCRPCGGTGKMPIDGDIADVQSDECPACGGSGLAADASGTKFVVVRTRKIAESIEVRAFSAEEAKEKALAGKRWEEIAPAIVEIEAQEVVGS